MKYNHFININKLNDTNNRDLTCKLGFGFSIKAGEHITHLFLFYSLLVIYIEFDIKINENILNNTLLLPIKISRLK
jgi:hypothetical protein